MSAKDRKARRDARSDPYDDIDIFSGPAGQVLVDIDPLYGGIQQQKDEKLGDQFSRDLARLAQQATTLLTPGAATQEEMQNAEKQRQEALQFLLKATGTDPDSIKGTNLAFRLRSDKDLQKILGIQPDLIKDLTYDFAKAGQFLFGDANKGLTTMTETGTKFKTLPFEQKLGIVALPIDALDLVGIGILGTKGLGTLVRGGIRQYGKKSGKTVQDLLSDVEFLNKLETENPGFIRQLEELGITPDAKFASKEKPLGPKVKDRDGDVFGIASTPIGFGTGQVDDSLARAAREAEALKRETDKFKQVDPSLKKSAQEADKKVTDFSLQYEAAFGSEKNRARNINKLKKQYGEEEYGRLEKLAIQKGLSKQRNFAPEGSVKKTTPDGEKFIEENAAKLSANELKLAMTQDEATMKKFFYTDGKGNPKVPPDSFFRQYPGAKFGILREGEVGQKGAQAKKKLALETDQKIYDQFDIFTGAEGFNMSDPRAVREAFAKAFVSPESKSKFSGFAITDQDVNFKRALSRKINDYNKSKGFDDFDKTKGFEKGRVYNRDQIQQINRFLSVGEESLEKTSIQNKFETYLNTNDIYNNLKNNMKQLDDSFYPIVKGNLKRDFSKKLKRYLNFVRDTSAQTKNPVGGSFDPFMTEFSDDMLALLDPNSIEYQNFLKFSYHDKIREEVGELAKPALNQIFKAPKKRPDGSIRTEKERIKDAKNSIQIAHTFEASQVGETVGEGLVGSGMIPGSYYLDLSNYNAIKQPQLEKKARAALDEFEATGDMSRLNEVDMELEKLGAEIAVGDFVLGKHKTLAEKLTDLTGGPPGSKERELIKQKTGVTDEQIAQLEQAIDLLNEAGFRVNNIAKTGKVVPMQSGGLVQDVDDIFEEEDSILEERLAQPRPRITVEFGDAAKGMVRRFGEEKPEEEVFNLQQKTTATPMQKTFDVQPMENIFTGEVQEANLKFPFYKLFTKPPVNETAPIPTPKDKLDNPTKKQKESLEQEKINKKDDIFDPSPDDNRSSLDLGNVDDIASTPKTNQPLIGVFYSDAERALQRPDTPKIFPNKQALLDFLAKNRIKKTELDDYGINSLLKGFDDVTPIPKLRVIQQIRSAPVRGMHVHATGFKSELIDTSNRGNIPIAFDGYREDGFLPGTQSERVLFIPKNKLPGDTGARPEAIFQGEDISNHNFGIANESDAYIVGWTRLTERQAILPTKLAGPQTKINVNKLTKEKTKNERSLQGLYAEARSKIERLANQRGMSQADINDIMIDFGSDIPKLSVIAKYADQLDQISPGLVNQMDELIVRNNELQEQITKASGVDPSGIVRVQFADEIQSDIMQAAAGRKQKLLATLRKIQEEGRESTTLPELDRIGNEALAFFEENKTVFRPLGKTDAEIETFRDSLSKIDAEIDDIINRFVETREISDVEMARVKTLLTDNIDSMIKDLIVISDKTYEGLFPDLPFKKREEWADALIKKDLFELAYRKYVLKDPNTPDYYSVTPEQFVIGRYGFQGNSATSAADRAADKAQQIRAFTENGEFKKSKYRGIGMSEFYGGPNSVDENGKHYTSVIEKILKTQAKANNSEFTVLNVQTKNGSQDVYRITDQNNNMVATLSNRGQAERLADTNPNYVIQTIRVPDEKSTTPSFAIKITEEMLEPYKTHKARGGLVEMIDIFEVA
jgi:hypothetical protein